MEKYLYHLTGLAHIMQDGLRPLIGEWASLCGEKEAMLYLCRYWDVRSPLGSMNVSVGDGDAPQYTNMYQCRGAAMAFVPDVIRSIAEFFDDDVLIAFTSINEAILHKASSADPKEIRGAVLYTYKNVEIPTDERLSQKVYRYSRETGRYSVELG